MKNGDIAFMEAILFNCVEKPENHVTFQSERRELCFKKN